MHSQSTISLNRLDVRAKPADAAACPDRLWPLSLLLPHFASSPLFSNISLSIVASAISVRKLRKKQTIFLAKCIARKKPIFCAWKSLCLPGKQTWAAAAWPSLVVEEEVVSYSRCSPSTSNSFHHFQLQQGHAKGKESVFSWNTRLMTHLLKRKNVL